MDLITMLIIPENLNPQSPSLKNTWSFVKFVKVLKYSSFGVSFAIILALGQNNPKFLNFQNPCPDLGQAKQSFGLFSNM